MVLLHTASLSLTTLIILCPGTRLTLTYVHWVSIEPWPQGTRVEQIPALPNEPLLNSRFARPTKRLIQESI